MEFRTMDEGELMFPGDAARVCHCGHRFGLHTWWTKSTAELIGEEGRNDFALVNP